MLIGSRIQAIRKSKRMSLTELSEKSGVQIATLSRIENLKMTGTLESHIAVAKAMGIDVTELYKNLDKEPTMLEVGQQHNRTDVFTHSEHSSYEILTKNILQKKMMPVLIKIEPAGKTNPEQNSVSAEKFIFVLEGSIEVTIQEQKYSLGKHNTLYFDASVTHFIKNTGKSTAKILCVMTPVSL